MKKTTKWQKLLAVMIAAGMMVSALAANTVMAADETNDTTRGGGIPASDLADIDSDEVGDFLDQNTPVEGTTPAEDDNAAANEITEGDEQTSSEESGTEGEGDGDTDTDETQYVAQIGETPYETLDDAIADAENGNIIELLQDCTLEERISIPQDWELTITAAEDAGITITDNARKGITLSTNSTLTIENVTLNTNGQIYLDGPNGTLTFREVELNMDGEMYQFNGDGYYCCAIAIEQPLSNLVFDGCEVSIENYPSSGSAIRWNGSGADTGYNISIIGTNLTSTNCYSGFVGTCDILISNGSTVNVIKHRGNGSNGSHFKISNSDVNFIENGSHGISAGELTITDGSTVVSDGNGMYGIYVSSEFYVDGTSTLDVTHNSSKGDFAGLKITSGVTDGKGTVKSGAKINITDNYCSGLSNNGVVVFEEGAELTITGNINDKGDSSHGGGIYNSGDIANLTLPSNAVICNNHAVTDGDDIFNNSNATITFGPVGTGWILDDCSDPIDGWYQDGEGARWTAHTEPTHMEEYSVTGDAATGLLALKAAHGVIVDPEPSDPEPENPPYIPDPDPSEPEEPSEPSEPGEEISDPETPQTSFPGTEPSVPDAIPGEPSAPSTEEIPDEDTPQTAQPPQTGARAAGSIVLLAGAAAAAAVNLRRKRK